MGSERTPKAKLDSKLRVLWFLEAYPVFAAHLRDHYLRPVKDREVVIHNLRPRA